jgi:hypothetical protein
VADFAIAMTVKAKTCPSMADGICDGNERGNDFGMG